MRKKDFIIGIGLPKTGTSTLRKALEILGYEHKKDFICGDYVHELRAWNADKYILTVRESADIWYDSVLRWSKKPGKDTKYFRKFRKKLYGAETPVGNKDTFIESYVRHNIKCLRYEPLVVCWEEGDGWERLCTYLDEPIPDVKFPHENENTFLPGPTGKTTGA